VKFSSKNLADLTVLETESSNEVQKLVVVVVVVN